MKEVSRILIVDDDSNILEVLDARLTASGFYVFKAGDAQTAKEILNREHVDLLISDMKMPVTSGMDLFLEIQKKLPNLPVIFLTAYGTIPDVVHAIKHGAVDYISKPFDGRELIKKIRQVLEVREQSKQENTQTNSQNAPTIPIPADDSGLDADKVKDSSDFLIFEDEFYWKKSLAMQELYSMIKKVAQPMLM